MLDAGAAAPDATQQAPEPSTASTGTATASNGNSGGGSNASSGTSSNSNTTNSQTDAANQPGASTAGGNGTSVAATTAADAANSGGAQAGSPASKTKSSSIDDDAADAGTVATTPQTPVGAAPSQPIAAAIAVNNTVSALPASDDGSSSGTTIGQATKARAKVTPPVEDDQDTPPTEGTREGALTKQPSSANKAATANAAAAESPGDSGAAPAPSGSAPQQAQAPANNQTALPAQTASNFSAEATRVTAQTDALVTATPANGTGASGAQTTSGAGKVEGLPDFGFSASNTIAPSVTVATSVSASPAAVPVAGLAVAIAARAQSGSTQFDIRLDPPELGRIDVRLDVDSSGQMTSHVTVDRADTLQLLQSQQPQLERALEQAGLKTADNGLQFTLRDQSFAGQNNSGSSNLPNATRLVIPDASLSPIETTQIYSRMGLGSGIDIRV